MALTRKTLKPLLMLLTAAALCLPSSAPAKVARVGSKQGASDYTISVFYFPGWKDDAKGLLFNKPWQPIQKYPERKPLIGWYREGNDDVTRKHLDQMRGAGIDVVVYDWYWGKDKKPFLNHAIESYLRVAKPGDARFSLAWANHFPVPIRRDQFTDMVRHWLKNYLHHPKYQTIDGKPVVYVLYLDHLRDNAKKFNATVKELLDEARAMAREDGLPGIYFVAGTAANQYWVNHHARDAGYDAFSSYNYHMGVDEQGNSERLTSSYPGVTEAYEKQWRWMLKHAKKPLIVPVSSGWDKRPWGGSGKGKEYHDNAGGDPKEFRRQLLKAKQVMDAHPDKTLKSMVICCWNEFGEGSYIEPTEQWGTAFLDAIKSVFAQ